MLAALKAPPDRSPLRTVTAVVSCEAGQRGHAWPAKNHGLFAWCLADAYSGCADANRDGRLEPTELFEFMQKMEAAGRELNVAETPKLVLPDATPPRLSEDGEKSDPQAGRGFLRKRPAPTWRPPRRASTPPRNWPERKSSPAFLWPDPLEGEGL